MNILVVNWQDRENPHAGGAEVHLFEICKRLVAWGHRVRLVCSGWAGAPASVELDGIPVTRVGGRHTFALRGPGAVRRAVAHERPDMLVEDVNKIPLYTARLVRGIPICVLVPHLFGTTAFHEASWPVAALTWLSEIPIPWAYRGAGFHAISESTRDDLVARGVPRERIRVIHPGIDAARFTPGGLDRTPRPSFLYVGRLKRYKGVDVTIEALARARAQRRDLTLRVAGAGDDLPRLRRLVTSRGLEDAVTFLGFVNEAQKLQLLRTSWANVFSSPKEGWGITVIESAACGTPSLASDSPGLRDSVRDGETGFLVPHGDPDALAARMLELAGDPGLVERLGQAGRRFAETLSWDATARATEAHLEELAHAYDD